MALIFYGAAVAGTCGAAVLQEPVSGADTIASRQLTKEGYALIDTETLKGYLESDPEKCVVIDARNPEEYQEVHIQGAVNVPQKHFSQYAHLLPQEKSAQIIFYCNGIKCGKSRKAAIKAIKMGYDNVLVYAEGMPVWEEKGMPIYAGPDYEKRIETTRISPQDLTVLIGSAGDNCTLVDVRDRDEYTEGHIPGAVNIPVASFSSESGILDKNSTIVVYCNSGGRSYNAYRKLMKLGYKKIYQSLFYDWKEQGLPVAQGASQGVSHRPLAGT